MKKRNSISWRLSGLIIGLFLVLFIAYATVSSSILHTKAVEDGEKFANEHTRYYASILSDNLNQTKKTLDTMKLVVEGTYNDNTITADSVLSMMENVLANNPSISGVATVLEEGVLPEKDSIDANLVDSQNRFIPFASKVKGEVYTNPASGLDKAGDGDWYIIPKEEKRSVLTEPISYKLGEETKSASSIAIPLLSKDNQFLGVISAHFDMGFLDELVKEMKPDGGYSSIITDQGLVVANSINQKLVGSNMAEALDWAPLKEGLIAGNVTNTYVDSKQLQEKAFNAFAPVNLQGIDEVWSIQTVIGRSTIIKTFTDFALITIIAGAAMILLMAGASSMFIHRNLRPLKFLYESMGTAASGDLTKKVDPEKIRKDEIGAVALAFNDMLGETSKVIQVVKESSTNLNESSTDVSRTVNEVTAASEEVALAVDEIAQGASQQSADAENTNQQMADLSTQIDVLSDLSREMEQFSMNAKESTDEGIEQVFQLRQHNEATNDMNRKVQQQIQSLTSRIAAIDKVIETIHGITAQTNLLALNASIEAARAGEHGKGFAVVAEEVRKLAEESSNETKVIQETVQEILNESEQTVALIAENGKLMEQNNHSVSNTEEAFNKNAELAKQLGQSVNQLSVKLTDMMDYKEQAMTAIQSVSAISQETAASAEEVSASAAEQQTQMQQVASSTEQMDKIANELQDVVNRFKVE